MHEKLPVHLQSTKNFEKVLLQFKFKHCSRAFKEELLDFCRSNQMTTGTVFLCHQTYGFDLANQSGEGVYQSLIELKEFHAKAGTDEVDL